MTWCREPLSQMSCNLVPKRRRSRVQQEDLSDKEKSQWSLFPRCKEANQQVITSLTPAEHLFVADGPLASCVSALTWMYSRQLFTCKKQTNQCYTRRHSAWFLGHTVNSWSRSSKLIYVGNRVSIPVFSISVSTWTCVVIVTKDKCVWPNLQERIDYLAQCSHFKQ